MVLGRPCADLFLLGISRAWRGRGEREMRERAERRGERERERAEGEERGEEKYLIFPLVEVTEIVLNLSSVVPDLFVQAKLGVRLETAPTSSHFLPSKHAHINGKLCERRRVGRCVCRRGSQFWAGYARLRL